LTRSASSLLTRAMPPPALLGLGVGLVATLIAWLGGRIDTLTGTIRDISSSFGPLVAELIDSGRFLSCNQDELCRYTGRLPAVPWFHVGLSRVVGEGLWAHLLVKNLLVYGLVGGCGAML